MNQKAKNQKFELSQIIDQNQMEENMMLYFVLNDHKSQNTSEPMALSIKTRQD